jgi:hypothetical protein
MITLAKDNTATPDAYSMSDGSDPVAVSFLLDGTSIPAAVTAIPATALYVWANDDTGNIGSYSGITVEITGSDTGITWELSTDENTWAASIALANIDVSVSHQAVQIYARAVALNDGSVATNNYVAAKVKITATENPA